MRALPLLLPFLVLLIGPAARAADQPLNGPGESVTPPSPPPSSIGPEQKGPGALHPSTVALEGSAGMGTPLGYLGASVVVSPIDALGLHGGAGLGQQGLQIEAGVRVRLRLSRDAFLAPGVSWSTGSYAAYESNREGTAFYWDRAHFVNGALAGEFLVERVLARVFVGFGVAYGRPVSFAQDCPESGCQPTFDDRSLVFVGVALSYGVF
jgi:hypothetical protein